MNEFFPELNEEFDYQKLTIIKILDEQHYGNQANMLAYYKGLPDKLILVIKKTPINLNDLTDKPSFTSKIWDKWRNDIYRKFKVNLPPTLNSAYVNIIYPANDKLIRKYSAKNFYIFKETSKFYFEVVLPYISSNQLDLLWVYNILDGKAEQETVIYRSQNENNNLNFILSHDMKWDGKDKNVYLIGLPIQKGIKSLRDLDKSHLQLLNSFMETHKIIAEKYDVPICSIKSYFHYPPSFYHLHVHFTLTTNSLDVPDYLGFGRNHFLTDVIQNIELMSDYYQTKDILVYIEDQSPLYQKYLNLADC